MENLPKENLDEKREKLLKRALDWYENLGRESHLVRGGKVILGSALMGAAIVYTGTGGEAAIGQLLAQAGTRAGFATGATVLGYSFDWILRTLEGEKTKEAKTLKEEFLKLRTLLGGASVALGAGISLALGGSLIAASLGVACFLLKKGANFYVDEILRKQGKDPSTTLRILKKIFNVGLTYGVGVMYATHAQAEANEAGTESEPKAEQVAVEQDKQSEQGETKEKVSKVPESGLKGKIEELTELLKRKLNAKLHGIPTITGHESAAGEGKAPELITAEPKQPEITGVEHKPEEMGPLVTDPAQTPKPAGTEQSQVETPKPTTSASDPDQKLSGQESLAEKTAPSTPHYTTPEKIEPGDGWTQTLERFFKNNKEIAEKLGYDENASQYDRAMTLRRIAERVGIIEGNAEHRLTAQAIGKYLTVEVGPNEQTIIKILDDEGEALVIHDEGSDFGHPKNRFEYGRGERHYRDGEEITADSSGGDKNASPAPGEKSSVNIWNRTVKSSSGDNIGVHYDQERLDHAVGPEMGGTGMRYDSRQEIPLHETQPEKSTNGKENSGTGTGDRSEVNIGEPIPASQVNGYAENTTRKIFEKLIDQIIGDRKFSAGDVSDLRNLWNGSPIAGNEKVSAEDIMKAGTSGSPAQDEIYYVLKELKRITGFREPKGAGFFTWPESAEEYLKEMMKSAAKSGIWNKVNEFINKM